MGELTELEPVMVERASSPERMRVLQRLGVLCGIAGGAWLGAAEAPAKLVSAGLSPFLISFLMVAGVFLGRWSLPAMARGTSEIRADILKAPHLVIWAIIAGCLWSVANTPHHLRDPGLGSEHSLSFVEYECTHRNPVECSLLSRIEACRPGEVDGRAGGRRLDVRWRQVLARVSASQISSQAATKGVVAALGAGVLWGTMYIPYRKAYLSGMNPLSFVSCFTLGELGMMTALAVFYLGGFTELWRQIVAVRHLQFWLLLAGFISVIGDIFQQYAVKSIGVSRGIPLSNSNQLWGLLWGALAFGEFRGWGHSAVAGAVYGSILMMAGGMAAISVPFDGHASTGSGAKQPTASSGATASTRNMSHQPWKESRPRIFPLDGGGMGCWSWLPPPRLSGPAASRIGPRSP